MSTRLFWLFFLSVVVASPQTALGKQCVWNNGGYVVRVEWYEQETMGLSTIGFHGATYHTPGSEGANRSRAGRQEFSVVDGEIVIPGLEAVGKKEWKPPEDATAQFVRSGDPVQVDEILNGQGRCIGRPGGPYVALVSAVGREALTDALRGFVGTVWLIGAGLGHALCAEKFRCATDWLATIEVIREETGRIYPGAKDLFYVGIPKSARWLDTVGTVYEARAVPGGDITAEEQTMTGCHLWTDDFDVWCAAEFASDWGMKTKVGGGCLAGQGRADCAVGYKGGIQLGANELVTGCHLWTDDFDYWCKVESSQEWGMKEKIGGGCISGQGKARCAAGYQGGAKVDTGVKLTGCHLWTDDFEWWCRREFGGAYKLQSKGGYGCFIGQGKGVCKP